MGVLRRALGLTLSRYDVLFPDSNHESVSTGNVIDVWLPKMVGSAPAWTVLPNIDKPSGTLDTYRMSSGLSWRDRRAMRQA